MNALNANKNIANQQRVAIAKAFFETTSKPSLFDIDFMEQAKHFATLNVVDKFFALSNTRKPTQEFIDATLTDEFNIIECLYMASKQAKENA